MKTIAIISQKGGAGKTTLALNLAVAAELKKIPSAIIDLDPQASATKWGDNRDDDAPPTVVSAQAERLKNVLEVAKQGAVKLSIIDTAPHSESSALTAARAADLILIPCRPAILDLQAITNTIDLAVLAKKDARVVFNAVPPRSVSLLEDARSVVRDLGGEAFSVSLGQRAAFMHSLTAGQTVQEYEASGKAAKEVEGLFQLVCNEIHLTLPRRKSTKAK